MKSETIDERNRPATLPSFWSRFWASLLRVGVLMPTVAAVLTGVLYIVTRQNLQASLLWAAVAAFLAWIGLSLPCTTLISIETVNPRSFGLLKSEMALYEPYCNNHWQVEDRPGSEASNSFNHLQEFMRTANGLSWMLETGYITSWEALNRVKEAFMEMNPDAVVIGEAFTDWLCIRGSKIPNSEFLLRDSAQAVCTLAPSASVFFKESLLPVNNSLGTSPAGASPVPAATGSSVPTEIQEASPSPSLAGTSPVPATTGSSVPSVTQESSTLPSPADDPVPLLSMGDPSTQQQARDQAKSILRQIRITLNRYVYNRWEGIIHTRNLLLGTIAIAGVVIYLLLTLAVVTKASIPSLVAGMVFYAVGAISGLFGWLYRGSLIDTTVDDYGLVTARLVATPLLSGLAGIGGVIITAVLYSPIKPDFAKSLENMFSLHPELIIAAALFGLFPSLIIGTLLKQSRLYVEDLKAVQPSYDGTY